MWCEEKERNPEILLSWSSSTPRTVPKPSAPATAPLTKKADCIDCSALCICQLRILQGSSLAELPPPPPPPLPSPCPLPHKKRFQEKTQISHCDPLSNRCFRKTLLLSPVLSSVLSVILLTSILFVCLLACLSQQLILSVQSACHRWTSVLMSLYETKMECWILCHLFRSLGENNYLNEFNLSKLLNDRGCNITTV